MAKSPTAEGLTLCEDVIIEQGTRYLTLINTFERRMVDAIPVKPFLFVVFAQLTNGQGKVPLELTIESLMTGDIFHQRFYVVDFRDPLQNVRAVFRVRDAEFATDGFYQVALAANGGLIAQKRFELQLRGGAE